ncbi:TPA: hypothetical protein MAX58_005603 [Klebsiella pneumoniae]|uniref:Uncharacterized protein n=1 Tax=Klebsiella pneumoniae TaxID=573 RepID=A0A809T0M7_KLEPN|nr:hypothetical protein [Klebsiella pneumoniae]HAZ4815844.1 hypothetical protein [Enterobacter cloacae]HBB4320754.1 hypothetical protein [Escherichia coli]HAZ4816905.1 hypothetical protein [Enterobacter cloacae]HBB4321196.1 hypothetical protein [Escherichia coli]
MARKLVEFDDVAAAAQKLKDAGKGVSLEIGNFCTLSTLFNQFGYVSD